MPQSLYDLLHPCIVKISTPEQLGTGFFVAPGLVLTCDHVVAPARQNNSPVQIVWHGQTARAQFKDSRPEEKADLALLTVDLSNHPCVLLQGGAEPRDELYTFGYTRNAPDGFSTTFESEGWAGEQQAMLKFKEGVVRHGTSGSPLLNLATGSVCGIVQITYDDTFQVGGKALQTRFIIQEFPELEALQKQYHQQSKQWIDSLDAQQRQRLNIGWINEASLPPPPKGAIEVFTSYAQKDEPLREELLKHLKQMKRQGLITGYDHNIDAGTDKKEEAKRYLDRAGIILLLVSPDYLDSDYHYDVEMGRALERHKEGKARVIPIILRYTADWNQTEFAGLLALPRNGKPADESNRDKAFSDIALEIRKVAEQLKNPQ